MLYRLRIRLFGGLVIEGPRESQGVSSGSSGALLALLAINRGQVWDRSRLASALWPDDPPERAKERLRQRIHHLGKLLDGLAGVAGMITIDRHTVALCQESVITDLSEFRGYLADAERVSSERLVRLEQAVATYAGELLEDFDLEPIAVERAVARDEHWQALKSLTSELTAGGRAEYAVPFARRLVQADPYSEEAGQIAMRVMGSTGRAQEVQRVYVGLRSALAELGMKPRPETDSIFEAACSAAVPPPKERADARPAESKKAEIEPIVAAARPRGVRKGRSAIVLAGGGLLVSSGIWFAVRAVDATPTNVFRFRSMGEASSRLTFQSRQIGFSGFEGPKIDGKTLRLIDGHLAAASGVWLRTPIPVKRFSTRFRFRVQNPPDNPGQLADGFTLTVQNDGPNVVGEHGSGLGYTGIVRSFGLAFHLFGAGSERRAGSTRTWGFCQKGQYPYGESKLDFDIGNGAVYEAALEFDGGRKVRASLGPVTASARQTIESELPVRELLHSPEGKAWIGFTAGTGMGWSQVEILDWRFEAD